MREVVKSYPHSGDKLIVGDQIWRTENWEVDVQQQLNRLFNELNKNQDILISMVDLNRSVDFEKRYMKKSKIGRTGGFILGNKDFDKLGTNKLGRVANKEEVIYLMPGNSIYREYIYDTL